MSNATRTDPIKKVHELLDKAEAAGLEAPGRVVLARETGATPSQIRTVKAQRTKRAREDAEAARNDLERTGSDGATSEPGTSAETADVNACEPSARRARFGRKRASAQVSDAPGGGKAVASAGFVFGSLVSIAANILAAWLIPAHAPTTWRPSIAAQVGAAVWPVILLVSVEVISRVPLPSRLMGKLAVIGGITVVAGGSAVISYGHIRAVLLSWGYDSLGAGVGPIVIDGLMMICGVAMLAKPVRTPDAPVVVEPAPEPVLPESFKALSLANGQPIAPAGDAWRDAVAQLSNGAGRG